MCWRPAGGPGLSPASGHRSWSPPDGRGSSVHASLPAPLLLISNLGQAKARIFSAAPDSGRAGQGSSGRPGRCDAAPDGGRRGPGVRAAPGSGPGARGDARTCPEAPPSPLLALPAPFTVLLTDSCVSESSCHWVLPVLRFPRFECADTR